MRTLVLLAATSALALATALHGDDSTRLLRLGAVCSSPNSVTTFREIRHYLGRNGLKVEYTLYSNYDALVKALHDGQVDIAWNAPLAHGKFHVMAGGSQALVMRDVDVNYRVKLIVRKEAAIGSLEDLKGKTMIFGSCDSADATVLPVYFLRKEGVNFDNVKVLSLHDEVDAKGCPCHSQHHVWKALQDGAARPALSARSCGANFRKRTLRKPPSSRTSGRRRRSATVSGRPARISTRTSGPASPD